jgi:hypothetical protein
MHLSIQREVPQNVAFFVGEQKYRDQEIGKYTTQVCAGNKQALLP